MKYIEKQFSQDKDWVGGRTIEMQVPEVSDLIQWVKDENHVALENAVGLIVADLRSHEFSDQATRDGAKYSDPKSSVEEQNLALARLNGTYSLDWDKPNFGKTRKGNRWQGYGDYVPRAKKELKDMGVSEPTDPQILKIAKAIKADDDEAQAKRRSLLED